RPYYTATALVMINPSPDRTLQPMQSINGSADVSPNAPVVDSQLEVLRSPMLTARLVDTLNLAHDPEWNPQLQPGAAAAPITAEEQQVVIAMVGKAIDVRRRGLTYAVEVNVTSA